MTTITEMPDTELSKNVDAFAIAVERYIGNEAGLEATRAHVAMLREAARRLSAPRQHSHGILIPRAWEERIAKRERGKNEGTLTPPPRCHDCEHLAITLRGTRRCWSDNVSSGGPISVVTGHSSGTSPTCASARGFWGRCGRNGKFFEPRKPRPPKPPKDY